MSLENHSIEKTVTYAVRRTVCDICNTPVPDGQVKLKLYASREYYHSDYYPHGIMKEDPSNPRDLDICSVECLAKNANGIALLLNTKIVPNIPENRKADYSPYGSSTVTLTAPPSMGSVLSVHSSGSVTTAGSSWTAV